ncbi:dual specificity phosphatasecatalytic domain protein, partial [Aphelenchoides avenae]
AVTQSEWLCHKRIGYLVNLTGNERLKVPECPCGDPRFHSPVELVIGISFKSPPQAILETFAQVNRFIAEARQRNMHILVFNSDGRNSCQALALQYMMNYHKISFDCARAYMERIVKVRLENNFQRALEMWERQLIQNQKLPPSLTSGPDFSSTTVLADRHRRGSMQRKIAWS